MPAGATYEPIATTTLGSAAATITFNSIAGTYTDLKLVFNGTGSTTLNAWLTFNNDSTALYSQTNLFGDGTAGGSTRQSAQSYIRLPYSIITTTPTFVSYDVFSYAGSTFKTVLLSAAADNNGSGYTTLQVGLYRSTSAITRLDLTTSTGNFAIGTTATLYGIKAA